MDAPREQVCAAFAAQLSDGLDFLVERNKPELADLTDRGEQAIQLDGPEPEVPDVDESTGFTVHTLILVVEGYVAGRNPTADMNVFLARVRQAAYRDRSLGGLAWGPLREEYGRSFFDGVAMGTLNDFDPFRTFGTSPGGYFCQEFRVRYATDPTDPSILINCLTGEAEGSEAA